MYVCCSRDIQNMKEKHGTHWRLFKDQGSSLSLVRAARSWAEWQNCLSKGNHKSMSRDNYRLWQFSASPSKPLCFVTQLWFSVSCTWRPPSSFEFTLQWAHLPQQDRTHETMKGEHGTGAGGMVTEGAELDKLGGKIAVEKQEWGPGRYLASSWGPRLESESLSLPTWSSLNLLHWFATLLFSWSKMK